MKIETREISRSEPPYIIAELSANHNGDLQRAFEQLKQTLAARGWFDSQLKVLQTRLEEQQQKLTNYQQEQGIVAVDEPLPPPHGFGFKDNFVRCFNFGTNLDNDTIPSQSISLNARLNCRN